MWVPFTELLGKTLVAVHVTAEDEDLGHDNQILFVCSDDTIFRLYHPQTCCEQVYVSEIVGEWSDLIDRPLLLAEEVSDDNHIVSPTGGPRGQDDSTTWTFYKLDTNRGGVTIRWIGTSNGYYSERVHFDLVDRSVRHLFLDPASEDWLDHRNADWRIGGLDRGRDVLTSLRRDVIMVVNLPPRKGHEAEYAALESVYGRWHEVGLTILGCCYETDRSRNGERMPGANWHALFPVSSHEYRVDADKHRDELFTWLCSPALGFGGPISGPFEMFLCDRRGRLAARFTPGTDPRGPEETSVLRALLESPVVSLE